MRRLLLLSSRSLRPALLARCAPAALAAACRTTQRSTAQQDVKYNLSDPCPAACGGSCTEQQECKARAHKAYANGEAKVLHRSMPTHCECWSEAPLPPAPPLNQLTWIHVQTPPGPCCATHNPPAASDPRSRHPPAAHHCCCCRCHCCHQQQYRAAAPQVPPA